MIGDNTSPLSPTEESDLASLQPFLTGPAPVTPQTQNPPTILGRIGEQAANLPSNILSGLGNLAGNVAQIGTPAEARTQISVPTPYDIPAARTIGEQVVDVGANLVSQLPAYLAPELAVGKLAAAGEVAGTVSRVAGSALSGYLNNSQDGTQAGLEQAGILGSLAAMSPLSRTARLLPTLGLAAGAGALTYNQTGDSTAAFTNAGILATLGLLPGAHPNGDAPIRSQEADAPQQASPLMLPWNQGRFTMGDGSNPVPVMVDATGGTYQPRNWTPFGGYLGDSPNSGVPLLGDRAPLTPGNLLGDRENPYAFTQGDVTSQPPGRPGNFVMGPDTTPVPANGGLPAPNAPLQLMAPDETMPPTKPVAATPNTPDDTHTLQMPPGMSQLQLHLPPDQSQIVSTAFKSADGKTVYVGNNWNDGHDLIPLAHGMWDDASGLPVSPGQNQRGFIVHNADGTQTFENRNDALAIAKKSGQAPADLNSPLNSTDLIDVRQAQSEKGNGDQTPIISPPTDDVTSQPDVIALPRPPALQDRYDRLGATNDSIASLQAAGADSPTHPGYRSLQDRYAERDAIQSGIDLHEAALNGQQPPTPAPTDVTSQMSDDENARVQSRHDNNVSRLKDIGSGNNGDPYEMLKAMQPSDRKVLFDTARKEGYKAGTVKKLAEVATQMHQADATVAPIITAPEPPARTPDPVIAPAKDLTDVTPTPAVVDAPPSVQPDTSTPAISTAPDPQKVQVDPNTPPSKLPPSKGGAALSGADDLLTSSTAHMAPLDQEDMQFYREQHAKYSDPTGDDYSPVDAQTQLDRMQELTDKYSGGPEAPPVPVSASDIAIARANQKANDALLNRGEVFKADRGGNVTSQRKAPKLMGAADEAWNSLSHVAEPDEPASNPPPSFSEDPVGNDKATVANIIDQLQMPEYDDTFEPKEGDSDLEAVRSELPADDSLDDDAKNADDASASETDKLGDLLKLVSKPDEAPKKANVVKAKRANLRAKRNQAGFVDRDMASYIARYGVTTLAGGTIGASMDKENRLRGFIIGAAAGGLLGHMGTRGLDFLMHDVPDRVKAEAKTWKDVTSQPGTSWEHTFDDLAAQDHGATGEGIANYARRVQRSLTMDDQVRDMRGIANLSGIERAATDGLKGMRESYDALPADKKAIVDKYVNERMMRKESYVDPADGKVKSRWVPKDMTGVDSKFTADMVMHPEILGQATAVRRLRALTQQIIAHSTFDGPFKEKLLSSIGEYHTDSYRIFMDSKYKPSQTLIDKAMDSIQWLGMYKGYDRPMLGKVIGSYLDEIYRNRATFQGGGGGESGTFDQILKRKGTMDPKVEAAILKEVPGAKSVDEIMTSHLSISDAAKELISDQIKKGNYMTPQYRDMLGYYSHPVEREAATLMKVMAAARAATLFRLVAEGASERSGLPLSLDPVDAVNRRATLQAQLTSATDPKIRQGIQVQLKDLRDRVLLPNTPNLGILSGRYVPPGMADMLPDMDKGVSGGNQFAVTQAIMNYNRVMKAGQTILNPINHLKWIYNAPILGAMAGTAPGDIINGFRVAVGKGKNAAILRRMQDLGIAETSVARSEFNTTAKQALGGTLDSSIVDKFFSNPIVSWAADKYGMSDNAIRIGTFLSREQQVLDRLAPDVLAGRVTSQEAAKLAEQEAIRYTNRYTINYSVVPGGLAYIRKFPFVSLYLTYAYEIARITKNIAMDAIGKGPYGKAAQPGAIAKLAGLATIPAAIQAMSRAALSPDDQKKWDQSIALDQPYAQPRYRAVLGKRADGSFRYVDFTSWIPTGDWNMFGRAVASGDWKQMLAANPILGTDNTPALNIATEIITGQDSRTGRPINTIGRTLDAARQEIAPAFLGGYEFDNLMRALQPNDDGQNGGLGVTRMGSGKGYSWQDLLWTYATTLRPTTINVDWQQRTAVAHAQSQIATERQFLMDTLATNMTSDVKQQAIKRFQDAATIIVAHMKAKMDGGISSPSQP